MGNFMLDVAGSTCRTEVDFLGERRLPIDALYGIQTLRAVENFRLSNRAIHAYPTLIQALLLVKRAAAFANHATGQLTSAKFSAIATACDELSKADLTAHFVVDILQGGAGTSTNMNINEVIANRAIEILGGRPGDYALVHPVDDVNMSQSTNDVYPTGARLAVMMSSAALLDGLDTLIAALDKKKQAFASIVKLGRTQLQDAIPITLGHEFGAFASALREERARIVEAKRLFTRLSLGGTAVGTGINASPDYARHALAELGRRTGLELSQADDLLAASWGTGDYVSYSGTLKRLAGTLSKIANDLRLLCSGPRGGLGEISLPSLQPGSSIMPGKVNPVIPEAVNQACFQVIGNDLTVTLAAGAGQLQLNAFMPVIMANLMDSGDLLARATRMLAEKCIDGIAANAERCDELLQASVGMATALVPQIGYDEAAAVAKQALLERKLVRDVALAKGMDSALLDRLLDPRALIEAD
jgi:aspartate ammonia-lyase